MLINHPTAAAVNVLPTITADPRTVQQNQQQKAAIVEPDKARPTFSAQVVAANTASRQQAAREAEVLLEQEQNAFEAWRDHLAAVPTIKVKTVMVEKTAFKDSQGRLGAALRILLHPSALQFVSAGGS